MSTDLTENHAVKLVAHAPERSRAPVIAGSVCCSSCCCCSCCLHSVGSLAGAAIGTTVAITKTKNREQALQTVAIYWVAFMVLLLLTVAATALSGSLIAVVIVVLLIVPGLQIAASIVSLLAVLMASDRRAALAATGHIALWSVVGGVVGAILLSIGLVLLFKI